ncbi:MAG TPA: alpha/beta hydrolase-fold protein [Solirubrobacteraceae bacterium]|nr:alpha/beta hydrolase-fold protein [Solirubrobacteraceae bacterium]
MRRVQVEIEAPSIGGAGTVIRYGHFGRPLLLFGAERARAWDLEGAGMIDAVADLIEAGRVKLYCVDSHDGASWSNRSIALEDRARAHDAYEAWIVDRVVPAIHADLAGAQEVMVSGCSMGAYHAANFALRRADLFSVALCMSGSYDPSHWDGWGERGTAAYFHNPMDYVAHLGGDHLDWLRSRANLLLVCGQGQWEDTTGALDSTRAFAALLESKGIRHELDLWGYDVAHDWPSWRAQLAHHLPRFC